MPADAPSPSSNKCCTLQRTVMRGQFSLEKSFRNCFKQLLLCVFERCPTHPVPLVTVNILSIFSNRTSPGAPAAACSLLGLQKSLGVLALGPEPLAAPLALGDPKLNHGVGELSLADPDSNKCLVLLCTPQQVFQTEIPIERA